MRYRTLKIVILGVLVMAAAVMGSMALRQISTAQENTVERLSDIDEREGYLLRDVSGYVGVYYKDTGYPVYITNIPMASLREADRELVKAGLAIPTRGALMETLEDLGS